MICPESGSWSVDAVVSEEVCHSNQALVAAGVRGQGRLALSSDGVCEIGHSYAPFVCDYVNFLGQLLSPPSHREMARRTLDSMICKRAGL